MKKNRKIELVIFDWAGTTTDYGSQAPVRVFDKTFSEKGMHFTKEEINAPMGMEKKAHIRSMLSTERGMQLWNTTFGRAWNEDDIEELYQRFEQNLREVVAEYSQPIHGVAETVAHLRGEGIKIGSTTGYTSEMMQYVLPVAEAGGYSPDCVITPDKTGYSRPTPFMIFACMKELNIYPPAHVVKVGDTIMDILEGKNAGVWTVGILEGSNLLGFSEEEYEQADPEQIENQKSIATEAYKDAGADLVIDSILDLPKAIRILNEQPIMKEGKNLC